MPQIQKQKLQEQKEAKGLLQLCSQITPTGCSWGLWWLIRPAGQKNKSIEREACIYRNANATQNQETLAKHGSQTFHLLKGKERGEKGRFPGNSQSRIGQEVEGIAVPVRGKHYVPQGTSGLAASFSHFDFLGMFFPLCFRKIFLKIRTKYIYILIYTYICMFIIFFSINGNKDKRKV